MAYQYYLFDFDGTLVDSMPSWISKMMHILHRAGVSYPENVIEIITPLGDKGTAEYFIRELGVPMTVSEMIAEMDEVALPAYRGKIPLKAGVYDALHRLREKGYHLAVLTASPHRMLDPCLKRTGVYDLFDFVWSCEDFGMTKGEVEIYRAAAREMQTTVDKVAFFDDNINAVGTAKAAGMYAVGVYDPSGDGFNAALRSTCDFYLEDFDGFNGL
ncbi:MAG: HAD-IA family hydrolase [Clostridia bacterium]|nr:HAD-IA family hydrolase [Clostridia bacterium]